MGTGWLELHAVLEVTQADLIARPLYRGHERRGTLVNVVDTFDAAAAARRRSDRARRVGGRGGGTTAAAAARGA